MARYRENEKITIARNLGFSSNKKGKDFKKRGKGIRGDREIPNIKQELFKEVATALGAENSSLEDKNMEKQNGKLTNIDKYKYKYEYKDNGVIAFQSIVPMKSLILDLVSSLLKSAKRLEKRKRIKREGEQNLNLFVDQTDHDFRGKDKVKEKEKEKEQQESVRKKEDRRNEGQMRGEGNDDTDIDTCGNRINNWDVQQIRGNEETTTNIYTDRDSGLSIKDGEVDGKVEGGGGKGVGGEGEGGKEGTREGGEKGEGEGHGDTLLLKSKVVTKALGQQADHDLRDEAGILPTEIRHPLIPIDTLPTHHLSS